MTDIAVQPELARHVEALAAAGPAWLAEFRRSALGRYDEAPLPSRVAHLWRYTDPSRLLPGDRSPVSSPFAFRAAHADGVLLTDLMTGAVEHGDLLRGRLGSLAATCDGEGAKFDAFSAALAKDGVLVHVGRNVRVAEPLVVGCRLEGGGISASRSVVIAEPGAEVTVVVHLDSAEDATTLLHDATEVFVGAGARVRMFLVQQLGRRVTHAPLMRARVERDGSIETVAVALGGGTVKSLQTAELAGPGASVSVLGIVYGDRRQHFDHHTFQDHVAPHTTSDLDYRTVANDRARSVYTGRLRIAVEGAGCEAHQRNHNLLLSDHARADTIPELEILTNDVMASHAAATGPIDQEQIHYCTSRGFDPDEARRTIVKGFLEPTLARIPDEDMLRSSREALDARLAAVRG